LDLCVLVRYLRQKLLFRGKRVAPGWPVGQHRRSRKQVAHPYAGTLRGAVREHPVRLQSAGNLAPPDSIVGLLELSFLPQIKNSEHHQPGRSQGKDGRLQAVEEAGFHGENALHRLFKLHVACHVIEIGWEESNRVQSTDSVQDRDSLAGSKVNHHEERFPKKMQENVGWLLKTESSYEKG
jgi:hypothetical protein